MKLNGFKAFSCGGGGRPLETTKKCGIQEDVETVVDEMNAKFLAPFSFEEQTALKGALNHIINLNTQK